MEGLWSSLAISAIVTIVVYGAFPFISARLRKKPITKKKWKRQVIISCVICMLIFSALGSVSGSGASNGLPALIWGTLFYNNGIKVLTQRGLLIDNDAATVSPSQASAVSEAESLLVEKESVLPPPSQQSEQVSHSQERSSAKDISTFPPTESISSNSPPPSENTKKQKAVSHQKNSRFFPLVILSVLTVCLAAYAVYLNWEIKQVTAEYEELLSTRNKTISQYSSQVWSLKSDISRLEREIEFYDEHIVFVPNDGTNLYHNYDCWKWRGSSFWAYNIDAAKSRGYSACSYCS